MINRVKGWVLAATVLLCAQAGAASLSDIQVSNGDSQARITFSFMGDPEYAFSQIDSRSVALDIKQTGVIQGLPLQFSGNNLVKSIRSGTPKDAQSLRLVVDLTEKGKTKAVKQQNGANYTVVFTINADVPPPPPAPVVAKRVEAPVYTPRPSEPARNPFKSQNDRLTAVTSSNTVTRPAVSAPRPTGANYPNAQPGYHKQQGALYRKLLDTPAVEHKEHITVSTPSLDGHSQSFGRVLTIIAPDMALLEREGKLLLLALSVAERWLKQAQLTPGVNAACAQPLLIPVRLKISPEETGVLRRVQTQLAEMGIEIVLDAQHVTIRAVPLPLRQQNLQNLIPELIGYLAQQTTFDAADTAQWIARHLASEHAPWSMAQAITVLAEVERLCPQLVKAPPGGLLQPVDLQTAMTALKHD